jgi:hypothetical protein
VSFVGCQGIWFLQRAGNRSRKSPTECGGSMCDQETSKLGRGSRLNRAVELLETNSANRQVTRNLYFWHISGYSSDILDDDDGIYI